MAIKTAFFCPATVMHKRLRPRINQFVYRVFYLCFDISKISALSSKFLSIDRFNLFSFYQRDHGKRDGSSLEAWIRKVLQEKNLNEKVEKIYLLTYPRVLGYVFNPVSFWFCVDSNQQLIAVLSEVNNTFGENHDYLVFNSDHSPISENQRFKAVKEFHVSPFFKVEGAYEFRFAFNQKNIGAWINYLGDDGEINLLTSVVCKKQELSNLALLRGFFSIPLMTLKVVILIHWQALKIIFKKIKYVSKPQQKTHKITFNNE
jgi:DUF1365 family protein